MIDKLETFEAPTGLSEVKFSTSVDVSCPYRDGRDEYEVAVIYGPQKLSATSGSLGEFIGGYEHATISGEELAVKVRDQVSESIDPRYLRVEVRLLNGPFELEACAE